MIYKISGTELNEGELCELGSQLRPHIVWFGEMVPALEEAAELVAGADVFIVVGTSLAVYPAAGLIHYAPVESEKFIVDPQAMEIKGFTAFRENAGSGIPTLVNKLMKNK
jgi:NAD-dependent deacetylase